MELLEFSRTALWASLVVFVLGTAWRLFSILTMTDKPDLSVPRKAGGLPAALRIIWTRSVGAPAFKRENVHLKVLGYSMHLGLFGAVLLFGPHVEALRQTTGIWWPTLPDPAVYVLAAGTMVILLVMMWRRLTHPVLKLLSNFDDHFSWLMTFSPLATGLMIPLGLGLAEETWVAIHNLNVALLLIWMPFGKLAHAYLLFVSRGTTGMILERRGART